jgi:hypothetical protein
MGNRERNEHAVFRGDKALLYWTRLKMTQCQKSVNHDGVQYMR